MNTPLNTLVFRRVAPFLAALTLSVGLAACGNGEADSPDLSLPEAGGEESGAESGTEAPPPQSPDGAPEIALGEMTLGTVDAPVTVIEYASLTCHHCASFHEATFSRLKPAYIDNGKIRFILRDFPLDRLAFEGSVLARCAGADQYFAVIDRLFSEQERWMPRDSSGSEISRARNLIRGYGEEFGVTDDAYDACLADKKLEARLIARIEEGRNRYDVRGTPALVINGEVYDGSRAFTMVSKHINELLPAP